MTIPVEQQESVGSIQSPFSQIARFLQAGGWRGEPEQEQALLRIAITVISLLYLLLSWPASENGTQLWAVGIQIASAFLAYSALFLVVTLVWPEPSVPRRIVGVTGDVGMTTLVLY
ncbi:MAG: hypothetical protein WBN43_09835, partial [Thiogranum sp.]